MESIGMDRHNLRWTLKPESVYQKLIWDFRNLKPFLTNFVQLNSQESWLKIKLKSEVNKKKGKYFRKKYESFKKQNVFIERWRDYYLDFLN